MRFRKDMAEPPQGEKECCDRKAFVALSVGIVAGETGSKPPPRRAKMKIRGPPDSACLPQQNDQRFGSSHRACLEHHLEFAAVVAFDDQKIRLAFIEPGPRRI